MFGCIFLGIRIGNAFKSLPESQRTVEALKYFAVLGTSIVFCFFNIISQNCSTFYLEEHLHPHPFVRANYTAKQMVNIIISNFPNIEINVSEILTDIVDLSNQILSHEPGQRAKYFDQGYLYSNKIDSYALKLDSLREVDNSLAIGFIKENTLKQPPKATQKL